MKRKGKCQGWTAAGPLLGALLMTGSVAGCNQGSDEGGQSATGTTGGTTTGTPSAGSATPGTTTGPSASSNTPGDGLRIVVIPKGTTHEFWKSIHAGAVKAQQELQAKGQKIEVIWKGAAREDDRESQVSLVENFVSQKVSGMVLAPLDNQALVRPVEAAESAGIPVVIIDSGVKSDKYVSFVATDNKKGGVLAGERLAKLLNGQGKVIMLRYQENSASTEEREAGFLEAIKKYPKITMLSQDQHAGATVDKAFEKSQTLLTKFGAEADGIFCPNESSAQGMLNAIKQSPKAGKVKFVGFDASEALLAAMKAGQIHGLVVQNPFKMGYLGVMTDVQAINKQKVEKRIDTGVQLATPENMDSAGMKDALHPPIDQYLK